jgi:hypothetical protein
VQERKEREAAGMVNAILSTPTPTTSPSTTKTWGEEEKKPPMTEGSKKEEEREGQQPPTCSSGQHRLCSLGTTKLLSGQVQAAAPIGLPKMLTGQFVFLQQFNNNHTFWMKQEKKQHAHNRPVPHLRRHCNRRGH